jgi:hypothetical protein
MKLTNLELNAYLQEIKVAANALVLLTVDLSLLAVVSQMALKVLQLVNTLSEKANGLSEDGFLALMGGSEEVVLLDEIVDMDTINELEAIILNEIEELQCPVIDEFFSQLIEKIEIRYCGLVEAIHQLNAELGKE